MGGLASLVTFGATYSRKRISIDPGSHKLAAKAPLCVLKFGQAYRPAPTKICLQSFVPQGLFPNRTSGQYNALLPVSRVLILMASSTGTTNILPEPMVPV